MRQILHGSDDRLLVIVGPCSIHDPAGTLEYAGFLRATGLGERELHRIRVEAGPLREIDLDDYAASRDFYLRYPDDLGVPFTRSVEDLVAAIHRGDADQRQLSRLREQFVQLEFAMKGCDLGVTMSIGISSLVGGVPPAADQLVAQADKALYCAKEQGKNRIVRDLSNQREPVAA